MLSQEDQLLVQKALAFFDKLTSREKTLLLENTLLMQYTKGMNVHRADNQCVGVLLIKTGELRTYIVSEEGKEITLYRLYPGDVCILSASCILQNITFDVFIDASKDSEVLLINALTFARLMEQNLYVENFSLKMTADRFSDVMWAMEQILFMSFDRRLAIFLLDESNKMQSNTIQLTHEQIAKYMGSAREVVSRMLKYFATEGILELHRGGVTLLDKQRLKQLTWPNEK